MDYCAISGKIFKVLSFSLLMKWVLVIVGIIVLLLLGVIMIKYYPSTTGKLIFWQDSDTGFVDPVSPNPRLSPIPTDAPLEVTGVTANCQQAKDGRKAACELVAKNYPSGCRWYIFWSFSACKNALEECSLAQDRASEECGS